MNKEIPRPRVILQPIGKALQHSQKPGPLQQEHDGGPDGHDIEANPQQTEESFEPKRPPFERRRIESDCESGNLEPEQRKQTCPADIDQTGPRIEWLDHRRGHNAIDEVPPGAVPISAPS